MTRPIEHREARVPEGLDTATPSLTSVAWSSSETLPFAAWAECGRRFGALGRGVSWWIGDWLLFGNEHYGEKYSRASRITGYDAQTLMNMAYVASHFAHGRRREVLSWSHHAEVASLSPDDQDRWLDFAIEQRLSVQSLRIEVRSARRSETGTASDEKRGQQTEAVVCPNCSHAFEVE